MKPDSVGTPEDPFVISFTPPTIPHVDVGEQYPFWLDIAVQYDDGFGNDQTLNSCLSFQLPRNRWEQSCMTVSSVDLSQENPTNTEQKKTIKPETPSLSRRNRFTS